MRNTNSFAGFEGNNLVRILVMFSYLVILSLGLHFYDLFIRSPLLKFFGVVFGFCASVIAWVPAYLINGIIFGQFEFANRVYNLYQSNDFSVAIALVFFLMPIAAIISRIINRAISWNSGKRLAFWIAVIFTFGSFGAAAEYVDSLQVKDQYAYIFSCSVIGLLYVVSLGRKPRPRRNNLVRHVEVY